MAERIPSEKQTADEKNRLIRIVQPELREHGLVDLTDFVNKNAGEGFRHEGFVRSLAFRMEEMGLVEVIPRKEWTEFYVKRAIWGKRHPYIYAFRLGAIGVLFSIVAGSSIALTKSWLSDKDVESQSSSVNLDTLSIKKSSTVKDLPDSTRKP